MRLEEDDEEARRMIEGEKELKEYFELMVVD
jgi:hypothetical protein